VPSAHDSHSGSGTPVPMATLAPAPTPAGGDDADAQMLAPGESARERESKPPQKRYRWTDEMKGILWALVCLSNECVRLENEKQ
jgi:hypothetical protein